MKIVILSVICFLLTTGLFGQHLEFNNVIGFGAGISPGKDYSIYISDPLDEWVTKNMGPIFQVFYARQVGVGFRLGSYLEYESASFNYNSYDYDNGYSSVNEKASRINIGVNWLGQYPNNAFHAQLGGYFGYGNISSSNWDQSLNGIDFGVMIGPAYEKGNYGIALHVQSGFGWYNSAGTPRGVIVVMPKFLLKLYRKF